MLQFLRTTPTFPLATALVGAALVVSWLLPTPVRGQTAVPAAATAVVPQTHAIEPTRLAAQGARDPRAHRATATRWSWR